jgi:hypothetical protein
MLVLLLLDAGGAHDGSRLLADVLPWLSALVALMVVGAVAIYLIRRTLTSDNALSSKTSFTLQDLRDMHAAGDLTDEEFQRAKDAMIGRLANTSTSSKPTPPRQQDAGAGNTQPPATGDLRQ